VRRGWGTGAALAEGDERDDGVDGVEHRVEAADLSVAAMVGSGCASGRDDEGPALVTPSGAATVTSRPVVA
jgi:hypothetical protein